MVVALLPSAHAFSDPFMNFYHASTGYGKPAGGVSYVGVFGMIDQYYQPALVFPAQLGGGDPKSVWEATSHELGHNLGLR